MADKKQKNPLFYEKRTVWEKASADRIEKAFEYAREYAKYLDVTKTEREAVTESIRMAEEWGFRPYTFGAPMKAGDRFYYNNRDKSLYLFSIGSEDIQNGIRITASHIDSPRLDLKQVPVFEENGMCYFKTHYYGGIRKYQWLAIPLALHGVVVLESGEVVNVTIGEDESDPVLYITDLLPHLAYTQNDKPLGKAFDPEKLNLLVGSRPLEGEESSAVKATVLQHLHDRYGICEEDFLSAELCAVPAGKARDMGLDRSMLCAYGHDDRVCAFPALTSFLVSCEKTKHTTMCILADKEETGSDGVTGMKSHLILDLIVEIAKALGGNEAQVRAASKCLSSDVAAVYDPSYADVFEKRNSSILGCGVSMCKFTGSKGKSGTSDASAELVAWVRRCFNAAGVVWQTCELGKIEAGGGGTVAKYLANHNIDTVDVGVGVLSMHAPYEAISKVDLYEAYRAFCAFYLY